MPRRKPTADPSRVHCEEHGESIACIICRHLREGSGLGYYAIREGPWAWCEDCNAFSESGKGWNRLYKFADWQVHCSRCYRRALRRHKRLAWVQYSSEE
jgi:hypothetical protein